MLAHENSLQGCTLGTRTVRGSLSHMQGRKGLKTASEHPSTDGMAETELKFLDISGRPGRRGCPGWALVSRLPHCESHSPA